MKQRELEWQAEDDARTLANYQGILDDKARMRRAIKKAKEQAADLQKRANNMTKAAGNAVKGK